MLTLYRFEFDRAYVYGKFDVGFYYLFKDNPSKRINNLILELREKDTINVIKYKLSYKIIKVNKS